MMRPETLYWSMLEWKFDVERVDLILGNNVEYIGSMSRLPILALECSKGSHLEREPCQTEENLTFPGGKHGWNWLKFSWGNPDPLAHHFQWESLTRRSSTVSKHAKTPCLGWEVARFGEATKRERRGDTLTGKQNSSASRFHPPPPRVRGVWIPPSPPGDSASAKESTHKNSRVCTTHDLMSRQVHLNQL